MAVPAAAVQSSGAALVHATLLLRPERIAVLPDGVGLSMDHATAASSCPRRASLCENASARAPIDTSLPPLSRAQVIRSTGVRSQRSPPLVAALASAAQPAATGRCYRQ